MEHNPGADWLTEAAKAAERQGPGNLLRIVLIVMVVGCVLVGWFLLRGYRQSSDSGSVRGVEHMPQGARGAGKDGVPREDSAGGEDGEDGEDSAGGAGTGSTPRSAPESTSDKSADHRNG
ncbi:hypothetical protein ACFVYR_15240 [Streptomyces sp. NPDC058284]|uniref:hypothetical protein n=1 Tax=unclassified Streptomyces TaxID=2593676 RepID=UPI0036673BED